MNKNIVLIISILAVASISFFILKDVSWMPTTEDRGKQTDTEKIKIDPNIPDITLPFSNAPKDVAWAVFQKYLEYNKNQNLEGVRSVVYRIADVCNDPKTTIECKSRMGLAYQYGSVLKKEDFVNVWSDKKQIILAGDFKTNEDDYIINRVRPIIFFIRNEAGDLKMLSFSPFKGASTSKGAASREELDYRIARYLEDKDEDGLSDYEEECLHTQEKTTCTATNPKIRDTDGDGWWDGVQALMEQTR